MQQETFLFNDTIFKNVEYGLMGTEWENASNDGKEILVRQACKEAYADEFIEMLPEVMFVTLDFGSNVNQQIGI